VFHVTLTPGIDHLVTLSGRLVDVVDQDSRAELDAGLFSQMMDGYHYVDGLASSHGTQHFCDYLASILRGIYDDLTTVPPFTT
jgi:hypothetical protein